MCRRPGGLESRAESMGERMSDSCSRASFEVGALVSQRALPMKDSWRNFKSVETANVYLILLEYLLAPGYHLETMNLKPFTYPFPETRFLHSGSNVYKFKIRYGNRVRREDIENKEVIVQELERSQPQAAVLWQLAKRKLPEDWAECRLQGSGKPRHPDHCLDSIRVVLGNLDNLQPFTTKHFIVFPYKSRWERVSHLKFKHGETALVPYPFVLTLYVEMKWFHGNLSPGKPINNSAPGLVLTEQEAAGATRKKRKRTEVSSSPSRPGLDRAKVRTSSQGPSKKKLLMETSKNRETETQQECQETSAFGVTGVQEQDSRWEDSQAGDIILPGQQSSPSPPRGPADLGTSGFFGFLSSLFPFRYFFRRSSQ